MKRLTAFWLSIVALLAASMPAAAQENTPMPVSGPNYLQAGEPIDGVGPARACQIPDEALKSTDALETFRKTVQFNVNKTLTDDALFSLAWETLDISKFKGWDWVITHSLHSCIENETTCPGMEIKDHVKRYRKNQEKGKDYPYKRYYLKKMGNSPTSELTALRYATVGACAVPRNSDFARHLQGVVIGDFPIKACELAWNMPKPAIETEWDRALFNASREFHKKKEIGLFKSCHVIPRGRYDVLMAQGDLQAGIELEEIAARERVQKQADADRRAKDSGRTRWRNNYGHLTLLNNGGSLGTCEDAKAYARSAQTWTGANTERQWWFFYQSDPVGACSMIPETFFTAQKEKAPDPVPETNPDGTYTLSDGFRDIGNAIQQDTKEYLECLERAERMGGGTCVRKSN